MPVPAVPAVDLGSAPNGHRVFSCFEMSRSVRYLFRHQEKPLWLVYGAGRTMACSRGGWSKFYQLNCASAQALPHPISPYLTNRLSMSLGLSTQCSVKCFSQNILRNTYKSSPLPKSWQSRKDKTSVPAECLWGTVAEGLWRYKHLPLHASHPQPHFHRGHHSTP